MSIQEQLAIAAKLKKENKNSVIGYALDCEIKIKQLERENDALRSALILAKQHIAAEFGFENWRIEQVNKLASAAMPNEKGQR